MNIKYGTCLGINTILLAIVLFVQPVLYAQEDPGLLDAIGKMGLSKPPLRATQAAPPVPKGFSFKSIADSLANDLSTSVAWVTKNYSAFEKGLVSDLSSIKGLATDTAQLGTQICQDVKTFASLTTAVDAPWLAKEATLKAIPVVKEAGTEIGETFRDTFIGEYSFTYRMMHEWYNEKQRDYDKAKAKVKGWMQETQDNFAIAKGLWCDNGVVTIDDEGQLYVNPPPEASWSAEFSKLQKESQKNVGKPQETTNHQWMMNEFARKKKEKEDEAKTRSRDLLIQGSAGASSGSGDICK